MASKCGNKYFFMEMIGRGLIGISIKAVQNLEGSLPRGYGIPFMEEPFDELDSLFPPIEKLILLRQEFLLFRNGS